MYSYNQKPNTRVSEQSKPIIKHLQESEYSVLVGKNNCGKSFLLKTLAQEWSGNASYLGPARYQNFNLLGAYSPRPNKKQDRFQQFLNQWLQEQQNIDNSPINLQEAIAELSDTQRTKLAEIMDLLLGVKMEILSTIEGNSMAQKYISCNGHNISYTSAGFRLIATLITSLLDSEYDTFLIDEPELGVSPEIQGVLADFLFDREHRAKYFPHIKVLILATHSTVFLDRKNVRNNFWIEKVGDEISVRQIQDRQQFNQIHFFLLGNRFETLYLPSAIILVEGKTDYDFIERVLAIRYPNAQFSLIAANSDSRIKDIVAIARSIFTDIQRSPYKGRIFAVLDSVHTPSLKQQLTTMGISQENVIVWPRNGIEYVYPPKILDRIFGEQGELSIGGDVVERNGVSYTKAELSKRVVVMLDRETVHHPDFQRSFLAAIEATISC